MDRTNGNAMSAITTTVTAATLTADRRDGAARFPGRTFPERRVAQAIRIRSRVDFRALGVRVGTEVTAREFGTAPRTDRGGAAAGGIPGAGEGFAPWREEKARTSGSSSKPR